MESATIRTPLEVVWHKRSALASCIAIDLAHLIRYSQKGGGVCVWGGGVNPQLSEVTWTLLHLNICKKISFDTSVKWIVEEFVEF